MSLISKTALCFPTSVSDKMNNMIIISNRYGGGGYIGIVNALCINVRYLHTGDIDTIITSSGSPSADLGGNEGGELPDPHCL